MLLLQRFQNKCSRSARTVEFMSHKQLRIPKRPLYEVFLHGIMRHQPDLPYQFVHKTITFNDTIILEKENSSYKREKNFFPCKK